METDKELSSSRWHRVMESGDFSNLKQHLAYKSDVHMSCIVHTFCIIEEENEIKNTIITKKEIIPL